VRLITAAAPAYLAERGTPQAVEDLKRHDCIVDTVSSHGDRWPLGTAAGRAEVRVDGVLAVNSGEFARDAAVAGVGIALLPDLSSPAASPPGGCVWSCPTPALPDTCKVEAGILLVHPQARHQKQRRAGADRLSGRAPRQTFRRHSRVAAERQRRTTGADVAIRLDSGGARGHVWPGCRSPQLLVSAQSRPRRFPPAAASRDTCHELIGHPGRARDGLNRPASVACLA
jgi:DNA-binding transcriptional LysR family regulator